MRGSILFIALILPRLGNSQSTINEQQWRQIQQELNEGLYRVQQDLKEEITKVIDNEINIDCGKHLHVASLRGCSAAQCSMVVVLCLWQTVWCRKLDFQWHTFKICYAIIIGKALLLFLLFQNGTTVLCSTIGIVLYVAT